MSQHSTLFDPPLELGTPIPILAKRGDLLLAHYLLGHNSGGNTTSRTRRAIYYRLSTADHQDHWAATLADPFLEYSSIRPLPAVRSALESPVGLGSARSWSLRVDVG